MTTSTPNGLLHTDSPRPEQEEPQPLLHLQDVNSFYGPAQVHFDLNLQVYPGEIVCLLGGNASGKSTTMKVILGLVTPQSGTVSFNGQNITGLATPKIIRMGIGSVPESRRIFANMTVRENLLMGAYQRKDAQAVNEDYERMLTLFPRLKERLHQRGGVLSGGEQQMLAFGRALMSRPRLICMDEPTMGLSPLYVDRVLDLIQEINRQGITIFMVEQNANLALQIAHRGYILQNGRIVLTGQAQALLDNIDVQNAYLGEGQS
jgi:branched-chain amino acid transport system ATP-binding protein